MQDDVTQTPALRLRGAAPRSRIHWRLGWRPDRWTLLAAAIYLGTAIYLTWPMADHFSTLLYGQGGDAFGAVGDMQQLISSHLDPFVAGNLHGIGGPEGRPWDYPLTIATAGAFIPRWIASLLFGAVPGWNMYVLVGYLFTGTAMFLFVRRLTGSIAAGLIAGWAYAFFPFADLNGQAHVDYIQNWVLVLLAWRGLELRVTPTRRNALWLGAAIVLALEWQPYFWLYAFAIAATLLVIDLVLSWRERTLKLHISRWAIALTPPVLLLIALALINRTYHVGVGTVPTEILSDFYTYGARPLDYLIPIPGSGLVSSSDFASSYAQGYAIGERALYVGWTVLVLAGLGLGVVLRAGWVDRRVRIAALSIAAFGLVAFVFSGIPTWRPFGLFTIYMPTWFIEHITTAWRVFARYVEVVELALTVLAGFAVAAITKSRHRWLGALLLIVISVVMVKDLWWKPIPATIGLPTNPVYQALGKYHDRKLAAEYPIMYDIWPDYNYMLGEEIHHHHLINGAAEGTTEETRDLWMGALNNNATAGELARLGVGWVMINGVNPASSTGTVPPPGNPGKGYSLVLNKGGWQLWRVTAKPAFGQAYPFIGFQRPAEQGTAGFMAAWMGNPKGTMEVESAHCADGCNAVVRFQIASYGRQRKLTFRYRGKVVARVKAPVGHVATVRIKLHLDGAKQSIALSETPRPQLGYSSTGQVIGGPFGIEICNPVLLPARKA